MVNIGVYKDLLECAYNLQTLHYEKSEIKLIKRESGEGIIGVQNRCYILTTHGDIEIVVDEKVVGNSHLKIEAKFISNISNVSEGDMRLLIMHQLEVEAFLGNDSYDVIECVCGFAKG